MSAMERAAEAPGNEGELIITRIFDAPRELVFRMWTDPQHLLQWWGPRHHPAVHAEHDPRPGGAWRACLRSVEGGPDLWQGGRYIEVVQPERLVYTFAWDEAHPAHGHEMRVELTFKAIGGKTEMIFRQTKLPSVAERDGHRGGWTSTFDRLDDYLRLMTA